MPSETVKAVSDDVRNAAETGAAALKDAISSAERRISEAAKTAEKALKDGADHLRAQAKAYAESAGPRVDEAQRYVVDQVKERPLTITLASFGVGLLVGLLFSSRDR